MLNKSIIIFLAILGLSIKPIFAADINEFYSLSDYSLKIDQATIKTGYTIDAFDANLAIGIFPKVLNKPTRINLRNITKLNIEQGQANDYLPPSGWEFNSDIYEYDLADKEVYNNQKPLIIEIALGRDTDNFKTIFYFDGNTQEWRPLPSNTDWINKKLRTKIYFPYSKLAVFDQINIRARGQASWYDQSKFKYFKHKNGDFAASNRYGKGSKLKVVNLDNGRSVDVIINDCGPEEKGDLQARIIDLDISAFKKLGNWRQGLLKNIIVEPIKITKMIEGC